MNSTDTSGSTRTFKTEIDANIQKVLESGQYVMGPMLKQFEDELAAYHGTKYAVGVGNGTDAIWLALMALGIGPGDEVITHPNTFFATAEAIWIAGATAVFVDCCPDDQVHRPGEDRGGHHAQDQGHHPRPPLRPVRRHGGHQEDRRQAQAQGHRGQRPGHRRARAEASRSASSATPSPPASSSRRTSAPSATAARWSPTTPTSTPRVRKLRNHGSTARNVHSFGFNSRLDDLHAGILSAKLKHIDEWNDERRKWAARYTAGLKGCKTFDLPVELPGYRHVFHLYVIETKKPERRDQLVDFLVENGVDAKTHYSIAIHKQAGYPWGKEARIVGSVANAEGNAACCVSLPMFPELTAEEVDYVIAKVMEWDAQFASQAPAGKGPPSPATAAVTASSIELDLSTGATGLRPGARFHTTPTRITSTSRHHSVMSQILRPRRRHGQARHAPRHRLPRQPQLRGRRHLRH